MDAPQTPWRSGQDAQRPDLPPWRLVRGGRPLKRWRYVGCFGPQAMLCVASARIGPARVAWWAIWDRGQRTLAEATHRRGSCVRLTPGTVEVDDGAVSIRLSFTETAGIEAISPHGGQPIWTRKQGGVPMSGSYSIAGRDVAVDAFGVVDDSAGWHARETAWVWSAGVGVAMSGAAVAWNLVEGVHDAPAASERTVWVDGAAHHVEPQVFSHDLARVGGLDFTPEATIVKRESLVVMSNDYEQPFGAFSGSLPVAGELAEGHGVMERHRVRW